MCPCLPSNVLACCRMPLGLPLRVCVCELHAVSRTSSQQASRLLVRIVKTVIVSARAPPHGCKCSVQLRRLRAWQLLSPAYWRGSRAQVLAGASVPLTSRLPQCCGECLREMPDVTWLRHCEACCTRTRGERVQPWLAGGCSSWPTLVGAPSCRPRSAR